MIMHSAHIEIACKNPKFIIESIKPDHKDTERFKVNMSSSKSKLIFDVEAEDISAMTAALNSYLRLVKSIEKL